MVPLTVLPPAAVAGTVTVVVTSETITTVVPLAVAVDALLAEIVVFTGIVPEAGAV